MIKYILHGGYSSVDNELNRAFYEEIARDIRDQGVILLCYFATKDEDNSSRFKEDSEMIRQQSHGKNLNFIVANEDDFIKQLKEADVLYLRGGNTEKLLDTLNKFNDLKDFLENKTVAGSSAGAYAIAKYSIFHDEGLIGRVREGLGLLPLRVICHYESIKFPPNLTSLTLLKATATELDLLVLKDFEWKVIKV